MSYSLEEKVKWFAISSRVVILFLQLLFNSAVPDHDAGVFVKPRDTNRTESNADAAVSFVFGGLTRWDGQYFLHIAEYGYTYENTLAFFPLFPLLLRQLSYFVIFLIDDVFGGFLFCRGFISIHTTLILVSVVLNNVLFVKTSIVLYKLSDIVLKSEKLAYASAILFCINPASIFFSAVYSESLYCFLTFYTLLKIKQKNSVVNNLLVGISGVARSNGVLNIGFIAYHYIELRTHGNLSFFFNIISSMGIFLSLLPFLTYQFYCYMKFCAPNTVSLPPFIFTYGLENNFVFPGSIPPWCKRTVPFAYSYVQEHYWNVGFLKYYHWKQIPNFLLATPIVCIIFDGLYKFVKHYKTLVLYLGFVRGSGFELPLSIFVYVAHCLALTVFSLLMIHVQVTTRLLASSSPVLYWFCAHYFSEPLKQTMDASALERLRKNESDYFHEGWSNKKSKWKTFILSHRFHGFPLFIKYYFLLYFVVGTFLFSNHLPWT